MNVTHTDLTDRLIGVAVFSLFLALLATPRHAPAAGMPADDGYFLSDGTRVGLDWRQDAMLVEVASAGSKTAAKTAVERVAKVSVAEPQKATPGRAIYRFDLPEPLDRATWMKRAAQMESDPAVRCVYPAFTYSPARLRSALTDEIIVRLADGATPESIAEPASPFRLRLLERDPFDEQLLYMKIENPSPFAALEISNRLFESETVLWAEPNFIVELRRNAVPNDPFFDRQWFLQNVGQYNGPADVDIDGLEAWNLTPGSPEIVVAVLDDGMDIDHDDLFDSIFVNPGEIPGNGVDDDGNGYTDDVTGWDFFQNDNNPRYESFRDFHATPVAGMIGAVTDNRVGVASIAPGCRILPVRLLGDSDPTIQIVSRSIQYAGTMADVLTMSWTMQPISTVTSSLQFAANSGRVGRGCVLAASTGNDSRIDAIGYPSSLDFIMAAGASNLFDQRSRYSNYAFGYGVFLLAPSSDPDVSNVPGVYTIKARYSSNHYTWFSGTSAAAPQLAAAAALVLSVSPNRTRSEVEQTLRTTADKVSPAIAQYDANGYSNEYGYGRLNVHRAVLAVASDLTAFNFDFSPDVVTPHGVLTFSGTIQNIAPAGSPRFWAEFWLSNSGTFASLDHLAVSAVPLSALPPGGTFNLGALSMNVLGGVPDGYYRVGIVLDRQDEVVERDESNNVAVAANHLLQVGAGSTRVDLAIRDFDFSPAEVEGGDLVSLAGRVENLGTQLSRAVWLEFWVSSNADGVLREHYLCDSALVGPLGPAEFFDLATLNRLVYTNQQGLPDGRYRVVAVVDGAAQQVDVQRTNNAAVQVEKWLTVGEFSGVGDWKMYR